MYKHAISIVRTSVFNASVLTWLTVSILENYLVWMHALLT